MEVEIKRFFILVVPYVFSSTLASFLMWGEGLKKHLTRLLIFTIFSSITQTLTYQIHFEFIRFLVEVISGYVVFWLVFQSSMKWAFRIYSTSYVLGIAAICFLCPIVLNMNHVTALEYIANPSLWWIQDVFIMPILILAGWLIYLVQPWFDDFLSVWRESLSRMTLLAVAIGLQLVVFTGILSQFMQEQMEMNTPRVMMYFVGFLALYMVSLYILLKFIQLNKRDIVLSTQESVSDSILEMINSIRGQRHDFVNHLQVLHGLYRQQRYDDLGDYLQQLMHEAGNYNEILKTDNPIISALVNAKLEQANQRGIKLEVDFRGSLAGLIEDSMELSRILGNLIDNAIDAVEQDSVEKLVRIAVRDEGPFTGILVSNPFKNEIPDCNVLFKTGYSTKGSHHSGLGLAISRKLARQIHGKLLCAVNDGWITFRLVLLRKVQPSEENQMDESIRS